MLILGLDPSLTNYGWALVDTKAIGKDRCVARGRHKTSAGSMEILRYKAHREHVKDLVAQYSPDRIAIEYPVFGELYSSGMYGLFLFSLEACYDTHSDVVFLSNSHRTAWVRRYLERPWSDISKADVIEAARKMTEGGKWSGDEADAFVIGHIGGLFWEYLDGDITEEDLSPYERQVLLEVKRPTRGKDAGKTIKKGLIYREEDRWFRFSRLGEG